MQLVDEDDRVLRLHQLFHNGLQALLELPAVFGARDDQRQIERQDALIGQKRGNIAVRNALGQALGDRGFPHSGLADQHGIILGATAKDLDHPLQFVFPPDQGIELVLHRGLGEIAAEFRQQRRFLGASGGGLFALHSAELLANRRQAKAALVQDLGRK